MLPDKRDESRVKPLEMEKKLSVGETAAIGSEISRTGIMDVVDETRRCYVLLRGLQTCNKIN